MLTGSHEIFLFFFWTKTEIKHWLAWIIKQPWSLLIGKPAFIPLLCVTEDMKGKWMMGGGGGRRSYANQNEYRSENLIQRVHVGLLMTLTFYENRRLCAVISLIKCSIEVRTPHRESTLSDRRTAIKWRELIFDKVKYVNAPCNWCCFGLFTQQIKRGKHHMLLVALALLIKRYGCVMAASKLEWWS